MDVEAIHEGIANACNLLPITIGSMTLKLRAYASLPGSIQPPVLAPVEMGGDYHQTFSGGSGAGLNAPTFQLGLFTSLGDLDSGRKILTACLAETGPSSVLAALEADRTLGGKCKALIVTRYHGAYRLYEVGGTSYLGSMIEVKVWA